MHGEFTIPWRQCQQHIVSRKEHPKDKRANPFTCGSGAGGDGQIVHEPRACRMSMAMNSGLTFSGLSISSDQALISSTLGDCHFPISFQAFQRDSRAARGNGFAFEQSGF